MISNSKLDVIFISDSVSTAMMRLSSYTTYREDTIAKKIGFVKFYLHSEREISQYLEPARVLDQGDFYQCAHFCKPVNYSL